MRLGHISCIDEVGNNPKEPATLAFVTPPPLTNIEPVGISQMASSFDCRSRSDMMIHRFNELPSGNPLLLVAKYPGNKKQQFH